MVKKGKGYSRKSPCVRGAYHQKLALPQERMLTPTRVMVTYLDDTTEEIECAGDIGFNPLGFYVFPRSLAQPPTLVNKDQIRKIVPMLGSAAKLVGA